MRSSFVLYTEYREHIKLLSNEERGVLLTAILDYAAGKTPELDGMALMAFSFIKSQMDRDFASYEEKIEQRRTAGRRGGRPKREPESEDEESEPEKAIGFSEENKKAKKANGFSEKAKKAIGFSEKQNNPVYVYDDVYVYDNDNVDDNVYLNTHNNACAREGRKSDEKQTERDANGLNARWSGNDPVYQSMTSESRSNFDEFWKRYPKQIGKNDALIEWKKLNINQQLFDEIMKGLESALNSRNWKESNGRFIPYPANFIAKQLWKIGYDAADSENQRPFNVMQNHDEWDVDGIEKYFNKQLFAERVDGSG